MWHTFKQTLTIASFKKKKKLLMALYKHNGELFPDRRGLIFRFFGRGRRFGRLIKLTSLMWLLFTSALFLILFTIFGLRLLFPGYIEDVVSSSQGLSIGVVSIGNGIEYSPEVPVSGVGKNDSIVRLPLIQGVLNEQSRSRIFRPPSKKRRLHLPCEVGFSESVDYMVEPKNVRNFSEFALDYVAVEDIHLGTSSFDPKFGGHQTLVERERSFYARDQTVHCGFVKGATGLPSTGFDLDEKDKAYMRICKVVVSSCIFGNSDFLRRPTSKKISDFSKRNVCFVMFVDEQTLSKLSSDGHVPDDGGHVGLWRVVVVRNLPYKDMRRTGKVPKLLSHRLFPSASYSIWIDSKLRLNADPMLIIEHFLWRPRAEYAISNHYDRHCVWEEVLQNKRLNKYNHTAIDEQFQFYQSDGLKRFDPLDPNTPLPSYVPEGSFIVRAHTAMSNLFSCLWFNEVDRFTSRDQLSFAHTYLKLRRLNPDQPFYLHMFKDCERRSLVKLFRHRIISSSLLAN